MRRKRQNKFDSLGVGLLAGMVVPLVIFMAIYFIGENSVAFSVYLKSLWKLNALLKVGSLCVLGNLAVFWIFLSKKYEKAARGVLGATLLYAMVVLISKAL